MLFHLHFTSLLFHQYYSADGARKDPVRIQLSHSSTTLCDAFLEGEGLESTASSITQIFLSPASGGTGHPERSREAACLHHEPCSFMDKLPFFLSRYNILTLLQVLMSLFPEICNDLCSFSIEIPPLQISSVTLTNLQLLVFILIINKFDKYLFNPSEIQESGKSLKINQRYLNIYTFTSTSPLYTSQHWKTLPPFNVQLNKGQHQDKQK